MRVGIAQMKTRAGDFDATVSRMVEHSRRAAEQGVDLLVFPAAALSGVTPVSACEREGFLLDELGALRHLADALACPCLVPVLTDLEGTPVPEAMLVSGGEVTPVRLGAYLEALSAGQDPDADGRHLPELPLAGARLGVAFTYDDLDGYGEYDYDVDVIVFLSTYGFATDDVSSALGTSLSEGRFSADAERTGAWVVGVGSLGCYDAQVFCGSSFVLAPWGEIAAQAPSLEEALLVCDVDPSAEGPLEEPLTPEVYDGPLMTWEALCLGLRETCEQLSRADACVLVDGTLPSMLVATLAADALGPTHVLALVSETGDHAADAASAALVRSLRLPEDNVRRAGPPVAGDPRLSRDLAEAHLAALARETGALALGDADKTELALGEPRGTCAARLLPLGDLYRSDVVALAHLRNTISPVIPQAAVAPLVPAGAEGLAEELPSDEARMEFVDLVLSSVVEWEMPLSDVVAERGHPEVVAAVVSRLRSLDGARAAQPPVIALSSRTLAEARGPMGLAWRDRPRPAEERLARRALDALAQEVRQGPGGRGGIDEREVDELLGHLRDFSQGGGFSSLGVRGLGSEAGPQPSLWEGPFSEN